MKKLLIILLTFIFLGCNQNHKKDDLLGNWDVVSMTYTETGEIEFPESDDGEFILIKSDSLYLMLGSGSEKVFAWKIKGDSIILDEDGPVYIKELTANKLIVEYDFFGIIQLELKKRKQ